MFNSMSIYQSVSMLIYRIDKDIILENNANWKKDKMSFFINSIFMGIVPNNIIFNLNEEEIYICIDGNQRLTSLYNFKHNKIPVIFSNKKNEHVYYDVLPVESEQNNKFTYRLLNQEEKSKFNQCNINVIVYKNLSHKNHLEILKRIN